MEQVKNMYFEELETVEEFDSVSEFAAAAAPWVGAGLAIIFT